VPAAQAAKRMLDAGAIGVPGWLGADFGLPDQATAAAPVPWLEVLLDRGVYPISLALWLFGRPDRVTVLPRCQAEEDASVSMLLGFPDGQTALLSASDRAYTSNEARVGGSAGQLRLHAPMCRPERVSVRRAPAASGGASPAASRHDLGPSWSSLRRWAKAGTSLARAYLPVDWVRTRTSRFPVQGHGYRHELDEATRCIAQGMTESPVMPLHESVMVMEVIDQICRAMQAPGRGSGT
jgi:predicted dehydrogenase